MSITIEEGLALARARLADDLHLAVAITTSPSTGDPQVSVVNVAVIDHPVSGEPVLAFVGRRGRKLTNLRGNGRVTIVARSGWEWVAVAGSVELAGPDDPHPLLSGERLRMLMRDIYHRAGGVHPDLDTYDEVMRQERRCAVLVTPDSAWTNPPGSEHKEP